MAIEVVKKTNFSEAIAELVEKKLDKSGGTMTGRLDIAKGAAFLQQRYVYPLEPVSVPNGKYEFQIELCPVTVSIGGQIRVILGSRYNTGNATGIIEKRIDLTTSNSSIAYQKSYYSDVSDATKNFFMISDVYIKNGKYCIKIIQNSGSNWVICTMICTGSGLNDLSNTITAPTISTETFITPVAIYTQQMNALVEERGTWTPIMKGGTVAGTNTYSRQLGTYVKHEKLITVRCNMLLTAKDSNMSGEMSIGGLPYLPRYSDGYGLSVDRFAGVALDSEYTQISGTVTPFGIVLIQNGSGKSPGSLKAPSITNTTQLIFSTTYEIA